MLTLDCADHHGALFQSPFGADQDVLRFPKRLRFNKIDPVFRLVALALPRIKLKLHDSAITDSFKQNKALKVSIVISDPIPIPKA